MGRNSSFEPTRDVTARALREDLATIDESIAQALLKEYGGISRAIALTWHGRLRRHPRLFHIDLEDLVAVSDVAIFEAWIVYRDGDISRETATGGFGGGFTTHVRRVIFWRVRDYVNELTRGAPDFGTRCDAHNGGLAYEPALQPDPEECVQDVQLREWLRHALPKLTIQQRAIVVGIAKGDSQSDLAEELGLDRRYVHREYHRALEKLRKQAENDHAW